jgi:hypothetical protein
VECILRIPYTLHEIVCSGVGREGKVVKIVTAEIKKIRNLMPFLLCIATKAVNSHFL